MARLCLLAASLLFSAGCWHSSQVTWKIEDRDAMKQALLQHVPLGTLLSDAEKFMRAEGFTCTVERNGTFYERLAWFDAGAKHEGIDFLSCWRTQNAGALFMSSNWSVALVLKDNVVTDVLVGHCLDGP